MSESTELNFDEARERVRAFIAVRERMQHLGDRIHECNGGDEAGGVTLWLDDLRALVADEPDYDEVLGDAFAKVSEERHREAKVYTLVERTAP